MAGRIQGITVEIGGDSTKLQTALKGVNSEIKNTQAQLRDVEKLLKLDPGNTELLAQKHRLLGDAVQETKQKLETLKTASEQANEALKNGTITQEQYDGLSAQDSGHFADVLAAASSNANTNVSMMGETFKYAAPIAGALGFSVEDTAEAIKLIITTYFNIYKTIIMTVLNAIKTVVTTVWNAIKTVVTTVVNGISSFLTTAWNTIKNTISNVVNAIKTAVSNGFNAMLNGIKSVVGKIASTIRDGFNAAVDFIKGLISSAFNWGKDLIMGIVDGIWSCISAVGDAVGAVADKIKSFLHFSVPDEGSLTDYDSWMPDFMKGLAHGIEESRGLIENAMDDVASDMIISPKVTPALAGASGAMINAGASGQSMVSAIREAVQGLAGQRGYDRGRHYAEGCGARRCG